jgi:hypothetical protein
MGDGDGKQEFERSAFIIMEARLSFMPAERNSRAPLVRLASPQVRPVVHRHVFLGKVGSDLGVISFGRFTRSNRSSRHTLTISSVSAVCTCFYGWEANEQCGLILSTAVAPLSLKMFVTNRSFRLVGISTF